MKFTNVQTVKIIAFLLLALVVTQALFTILYVAEINPSRQLFWGLEGLLFTILAAFAGAAMVQAKNHYVGWSAIAFSAVFNVVQVSIGATMFVPFREVASQVEALGAAAGAVVAFSFMIYYAAKFLLGFAALIFGVSKINGSAKVLGGLTASVGIVAMFANAILITFGRNSFLPSAVAGVSGVLATLLLAFCLLSIIRED
ncbi:thiamine biosynthesis protein ThiC [Microbulbifer sp. A4B17]|uniref:thiamine biosynthesis protein ThiC n=1 Tax=Microbulbifer sp. A4B17 TaxID=359370 RepID=UPI000D52D5D4|nr:thiamine biosynthesis protein ThiC [Microbulbifer sp. A4B17]AWF80195.1 thiamine biosynthesis protein ThiC [Microbulbifer sp. A4B17]